MLTNTFDIRISSEFRTSAHSSLLPLNAIKPEEFPYPQRRLSFPFNPLKNSQNSQNSQSNPPPPIPPQSPTMTITTPLLTVFGAIGAQGGSLIAYMLAHPSLSKSHRLRGVTRDIHKPASVELREKGVEMVQVSEYICVYCGELEGGEEDR